MPYTCQQYIQECPFPRARFPVSHIRDWPSVPSYTWMTLCLRWSAKYDRPLLLDSDNLEFTDPHAAQTRK